MNLSKLKNIFRKSKNEVPRRKLTTESTDLLRTTLVSALTEMLKDSCPCHYPRFRELTTFLHDNYNAGPVFCADTNYLISCSSNKELNYLTETKRISDGGLGDFADIIYCCRYCSTIYRQVTRQYSINFEFLYFIIEDKKFGKDIGDRIVKPFPLFQGLFGYKDSEILKCSKDFTLTDSNEFYNYLIQKV
jgi:hypothetical protein